MKQVELVTALALSVALSGGAARGGPPPPTVIARDGGCVGLTADGRPVALAAAITTSEQEPGWIVLTCRGTLPQGVRPPTTTQPIDGEGAGRCETALGTTPYWREVIAVTGAVTIVCRHLHTAAGDEARSDCGAEPVDRAHGAPPELGAPMVNCHPQAVELAAVRLRDRVSPRGRLPIAIDSSSVRIAAPRVGVRDPTAW